MDVRLKALRDRVEGMRRERLRYEDKWREIARFVSPGCTAFPEDFEKHGEDDSDDVLNCAPTVALRVLASGMQAGLTSPSRPWFRLTVPDIALADYEPVKEWLGFVQSLMYEVFGKSNFYNVTHQFYGQLAGPGTAAMYIEEYGGAGISCRCFDVGSYWLANNRHGVADVFVRLSKMTAAQMAEMFGEEACSQEVRRALRYGSREEPFSVWCAIEPNGEWRESAMGWRGMRFRCAYWQDGAGTDEFLRIAGFHEMPVMAARWDVGDGRVYGRSPSWTALGDCRMLPQLESACLSGLDRMVDPPLVAPSALLNKIDTLPGGVTYYDDMGNAPIRGLYDAVQLPIQYIDAKIAAVTERIKSVFFNDLFMMLTASNQSGMTAREITERHEEKLLMLGPVIERTKFELLDPVIDRVFGILLRAGALPPPPEELSGVPLQVDYISILAQAQKMTGLASMNELASMTAALVQIGKPEAVDKLNADQFVDEAGRMLGVPPGVVLSDEDVAELRRQREEAARQQQLEAQAAAAMQQAPAAAKDLADTPLGDGTALDALMSLSGGNSI